MLYHLICIFYYSLTVLANLESTVFIVPSQTSGTSLLLNDSIIPLDFDETQRKQLITLDIPPPFKGAYDQLYQVRGLSPGSINHIKLSWSALDPIDIVKFDVLQQDDATLIRLKAEYHCFSSDPRFMANAHPVNVLITATDLTWLVQPAQVLGKLPTIAPFLLLLWLSYHCINTLSGALAYYLYSYKSV